MTSLRRTVPLVAVATALVAGGLAAALQEPAYGLVETEAVGLTVGGVGGAEAPRFDIRDLAPGTEGEEATFVVTRSGRPLPGTLTLRAIDLVDDGGACPEPEREASGGCQQRGELSQQVDVDVHAAAYAAGTCGLSQPVAYDVRLADLAARDLTVRRFTGSPLQEQVCVTLRIQLPDRPDNNVVQGDRVAFGLRFTATGSKTQEDA